MTLAEKKILIKNLIKIDGIDEGEILELIVIPPDTALGDLSLPCFKFAKILRKSPFVVAQELATSINNLPIIFSKAEAVGGYVNFWENKSIKTIEVINDVISKGEQYGSSCEGLGKTICIDYSSINIAKPFHIGHLSTTVIGGALYRIYKKLGYNVVGINHLGDWGTQFGKLIVAFKKWGNVETLKERGMSALTEIYVKYHTEAESDLSLDELARAWFKKIEDNDKEALSYFNLFKEITLLEVQKIYDRLQIEFDSYNGEAFYNDKMQPVLTELKDKKLLTISDGAKVVNLDDYNMPPCLLVKADGATLYATRDLAAVFYRKQTYDFYKTLYVVAYQQNLHFKQWFKVVEMMGYEWAKNLVHVQFGMVSLEEGTMSTRKGKVVLLEDVLNKAKQKALEIISEKNSGLENKEAVAEEIGIGAVVFSALSNNRIKDIVFSYDKVLSFEGETGPYIQYTNARALSVLAKTNFSNKDISEYQITENDVTVLSSKESQDLITYLDRYSQILCDVVERYEPSLLSRYLIDTAQCFNKFYFENRIIGSECEKALLKLVLASQTVLKNGLSLLGIKSPNKM